MTTAAATRSQPEKTTALDRPAGANWHVITQRPGESVPDQVAFFRTKNEAARYSDGEAIEPICSRSCRP